PVELKASSRALKLLDSTGMMGREEVSGARAVLRAAALTYVASVIASLLQLLRLVMLANRRR
ncbi:MAG: zinc metallopeptidase, partial [Lachnospiraceae bacterium]|nr:zinc metallopeptidase [Lachnospiraceae bacterium]